MLIDYVVGGLQVILIGLIVYGGVLCAREGAKREGDAEDAQGSPRTERRLSSSDRAPSPRTGRLDRGAPM